VAAFAVSCYASSQERTLKPFNPLLGETFEYARADLLFIPGTFCPAFNSWNFSLRRYARADLGFRYVSEKVAGSPTTAIAFHAESFDSATFDADEVSTQASKQASMHACMYVCMVARMRGLLAFPADRLADKRTGCG
jgi:hypothetical protein